MFYKQDHKMESRTGARRSSPEFASSRTSNVSRGMSSGYETGAIYSYSSLGTKESQELPTMSRVGSSEGTNYPFGLRKEGRGYMTESELTTRSPTPGSSRRFESVKREIDQDSIFTRNRSASPVWLSKKMKEIALKESEDKSNPSGDKLPPYSPLFTAKAGRSKSDLDPSSSRRLTGLGSPTESMNYMKDPLYFLCTDGDLSPVGSSISRNSGLLSEDIRVRDSPLRHYKFASESFNTNMKSPDFCQETPKKEALKSDYQNLRHEVYDSRDSRDTRDRSNSFHDLREPSTASRDLTKTRVRHKTLAYGVSGRDLDRAKFSQTRRSSDEDMKNILRELEDTGYFSKVMFVFADPHKRILLTLKYPLSMKFKLLRINFYHLIDIDRAKTFRLSSHLWPFRSFTFCAIQFRHNFSMSWNPRTQPLNN